jgi:hypothetical protein
LPYELSGNIQFIASMSFLINSDTFLVHIRLSYTLSEITVIQLVK